MLCALLAGIVTLNVFSLSINTTSGRVEQQISELERSNSALRATLADELSASKVELAAANLGLYTPPGDEVVFIDAADNDLAKLIALLENDTVLTDDTPVEVYAPTDAERELVRRGARSARRARRDRVGARLRRPRPAPAPERPRPGRARHPAPRAASGSREAGDAPHRQAPGPPLLRLPRASSASRWPAPPGSRG